MSIRESIAQLLVDEIMDALLASEICDDDKARYLSNDIFRRIQQKLGGNEIYIPAKNTEQRNIKIRGSFDGTNHAEICKRFSISLATFYRVIGDKV